MEPILGQSFETIERVGGFVTVPYRVSQENAEQIASLVQGFAPAGVTCDPMTVIVSQAGGRPTGPGAAAVAYHIIWCD